MKYTYTFKENCTLANDYGFDFVQELNAGYYDLTQIDLYDALNEYLDGNMIYYSEQWELLKEYFNPDDLCENALSEAYMCLIDDIMKGISEVVE